LTGGSAKEVSVDFVSKSSSPIADTLASSLAEASTATAASAVAASDDDTPFDTAVCVAASADVTSTSVLSSSSSSSSVSSVAVAGRSTRSKRTKTTVAMPSEDAATSSRLETNTTTTNTAATTTTGQTSTVQGEEGGGEKEEGNDLNGAAPLPPQAKKAVRAPGSHEELFEVSALEAKDEERGGEGGGSGESKSGASGGGGGEGSERQAAPHCLGEEVSPPDTDKQKAVAASAEAAAVGGSAKELETSPPSAGTSTAEEASASSTPSTSGPALEGLDTKRPCIIFLDSAKLHHSQSVFRYLRKYIELVWNETRLSSHGPRVFDAQTLPGFSPKIPQQMNGCDCGVYLLHFVEKICGNPPDITPEFVEQKGNKAGGGGGQSGERTGSDRNASRDNGGQSAGAARPSKFSLLDEFPVAEIAEKRKTIKALILRLAHEQKRQELELAATL